ncbi:ROK family protein [Kribbella solani]|uniref:Glucokinase n=1 Tax=Kribbella solani TaxID=236067 RepID=A0A841E2V3_9ACTN|nr:ROK family protein [Kribbella solani]MBB5983290.1 glucokinase [Kribbella solani]
MDVAVLEVGGSHATAAVVTPGTWQVTEMDRAELESQAAAAQVVEQLADAARKLPLANGLAIALPGPFDFATGVAWYRGQGKFDQLYGFDLGAALRTELGIERVMFMNDAEAFAVGEWTAGQVRGVERCLGVTIGTGIGTAFLADGRVVRDGNAVPPGGELYKTKYAGKPLEDSISARAIQRRYTNRTAPEAPSARKTEAPSARETAVPGARETEAPGAKETAAPGAKETGALGARETEAPGAKETGALGARETEAPGAKETAALGVKEIADRARAGDTVAREVLVDAFTDLSSALQPWIDRFGVTSTVLGGSISGAYDLIADALTFPATPTPDTEHSALLGAAAHYLRTT